MAESKQEHFAFNFGKDLTLKETPQQAAASDVPAAASAEARSVEGGAAPTLGVVASTPAGDEQAQQQPEEGEQAWIELAAAQEEHGSTVSTVHLPCIVRLQRLALPMAASERAPFTQPAVDWERPMRRAVRQSDQAAFGVGWILPWQHLLCQRSGCMGLLDEQQLLRWPQVHSLAK